jgi:hypothetical protein
VHPAMINSTCSLFVFWRGEVSPINVGRAFSLWTMEGKPLFHDLLFFVLYTIRTTSEHAALYVVSVVTLEDMTCQSKLSTSGKSITPTASDRFLVNQTQNDSPEVKGSSARVFMAAIAFTSTKRLLVLPVETVRCRQRTRQSH